MNIELDTKKMQTSKSLSRKAVFGFSSKISGAAQAVIKRIQAQSQDSALEEWHRLEFRKEYPRKRYFGEDGL